MQGRQFLEQFFTTRKTACHDCRQIIELPVGYDGIPYSSGIHHWFFEKETGVFACCRVKKEQLREKKSAIYRHCQAEQ